MKTNDDSHIQNFENYVSGARTDLIEFLEQMLPLWNSSVREMTPELLPIIQRFDWTISQGKMVRGALVKLGYELQKPPATQKILFPAAALEIAHSALLAQDDIIDKSATRRGAVTLYRAIGERDRHYGISQTICLGDRGLFLAYKLFLESDFALHKKTLALKLYTEAILNTLMGQMLDIELPQKKTLRSTKAVITIHRLKTAFYTIVTPLALGVTLAGGSQEMLSQVKNYGENVGLAFQIQDDILGVFGDEKKLGKPVTSDTEEGKNSLLITYALQHAKSHEREFLNRYYGYGSLKRKEHEEIKRIFRDSGALRYSQKEARRFIHKALRVIPKLTKDRYYSSLLTGLAYFVIHREK